MELKWLEDFVCLARVGNFSRASEERNITQPGFSRRIRALEEWLGATLVDRSSYPITLTNYGEKFLPHAEEMLKRCKDIREDFRMMGDRQRDLVRVVALHTISTSWLPERVAGFLRENSEAHIEVVPSIQGLDEHFDTLIGGLAHLLIVFNQDDISVARLEQENLTWSILDHDVFVPVARGDLAATLHFGGEGRADIPFLAYSSFSFSDKVIRKAIAPIAHRLRVVYENGLSGSLLSVARQGAGVAWVPRRIAQPFLDRGDIVVVGDETLQAQFDIVGYRRKRKGPPLFEKFWSSLQSARET